MNTTPARRVLALTVVASTLLLSGCSGGASTSSVGSADSAATAEATPGSGPDLAGPGADAAKRAGEPAANVGSPGAVAVAPKIARSASIDVRVGDITASAAKVRAIATSLQGFVVSEQIGKGGEQPVPAQPSPEPFDGFGTMTLSVPSDRLDAALDQLGSARLGTVLARSTSSTDVTQQHVDTESRLKTMRASVDRVRVLMAQAKDIGQVVTLETELSRRQADLEALESQLTALKGTVERSTITVSLRTPGHEPTQNDGFLAGLSAGWNAFQTSVRGLLTAVGAALPFVVLLALIGFPVLAWLRRRRTAGPGATPAVSGSPTPTAPAAP